jgi:uncharacterized protein (DUF1810 family)
MTIPSNLQGDSLEAETDTYNLQRFINAQETTFDVARGELTAGQKRSHWMWFIFPQIKGLGSSPTAQRFAISSLEEGAAYLEHPILGRRLEECTVIANGVHRSIQEVFGYPDDLKFHSSMTLFSKVAEECGFETQVFSSITWSKPTAFQAVRFSAVLD